LLYNAGLLFVAKLDTGSFIPSFDDLQILFDAVIQPAALIAHARQLNEVLFCVVIVLGVLSFTPAHLVRPSLPSAIVSALGLGIWYGSFVMMMSRAG
jgi:hypothetical protein